MTIAYNILYHPSTKLIQEKIKNGEKGYRTKWGNYGTYQWLENLEKAELLETIEGKTSRVYMSGHNDFPMFEISDGINKYQFERRGEEPLYQVGKRAKVICCKLKYIRPSSILDETLTELIIEIED